jgi:hypothetical protein
MNVIPCCEAFGALLSYAGEKGVAIVPRVCGGHRQFVLQARPFERAIVEVLSQVDPATGQNGWPSLESVTGEVTPFVTVLNLPLKHCPACGGALETLISQNFQTFDEAAKFHQNLWES